MAIWLSRLQGTGAKRALACRISLRRCKAISDQALDLSKRLARSPPPQIAKRYQKILDLHRGRDAMDHEWDDPQLLPTPQTFLLESD